jgi:hypothetical protein
VLIKKFTLTLFLLLFFRVVSAFFPLKVINDKKLNTSESRQVNIQYIFESQCPGFKWSQCPRFKWCNCFIVKFYISSFATRALLLVIQIALKTRPLECLL